MATIRLSINGAARELDAAPEMPLLWALRDALGLTGTKYGCGLGVCGACTVLLEGRAVRSCQLPIGEIGARAVTTIEGLSADLSHPCQRAWLEVDVAQCGYCQPAMILSAAALLAETPSPTDADVERALADVVCRCGTYSRIRRAVARASAITAENARAPAAEAR